MVEMAKNLELWETGRLVPYAKNARTHSDEQVSKIAASITEFGFTNPILVDSSDGIIAGHGRLMAAQSLGIEKVPVIVLDHLTDAQRRAYILADNRLALDASWDEDLLSEELTALSREGFDMALTGFDEDELSELIQEDEDFSSEENDLTRDKKTVFLSEKFGIPPFSILDTRQGYWQERKKKWIDLLLDDNTQGESREETLFKSGGSEANQKITAIGTVSILDPVLCEILVRWFCPKNGTAFNSFSGDHIFGGVAGSLGVKFKGIELRAEQVEINRRHIERMKVPAEYICDDGQNVLNHYAENSRDFFFSCPPYFDLEQYSDDPRDISNQNYEGFRSVLEKAFTGMSKILKDNRFACIVMSNVRDKKGFYQDICGDIRSIMKKNGLHLYNELILVNSVGSASLRAANYMKSRKVARTHQNVMVFYKGQDGIDILKENQFDVMDRLESIEMHTDVMVFFKGNPKKIRPDFGEVDSNNLFEESEEV